MVWNGGASTSSSWVFPYDQSMTGSAAPKEAPHSPFEAAPAPLNAPESSHPPDAHKSSASPAPGDPYQASRRARWKGSLQRQPQADNSDASARQQQHKQTRESDAAQSPAREPT